MEYYQKDQFETIEFLEGERDRRLIQEVMAENIPNLGRDLDIQVCETHKLTNKITLRRSSPRHIILKLSKIKDKEKILKTALDEKFMMCYRGTPHEAMSRFLSRNP